jgi:hypothetical protein
MSPGMIKKISFPNLKEFHYSCNRWKSGNNNISIGLANNQLGKLFSIEIDNCETLRASTALKNVPVVSFSASTYLKDISGLGENKVVTIIECHNICDFSSLKKVSKITIKNCEGFGSRSCTMENVQILTIDSCNNFNDTSLLGKVRNLNLLNCLCIRLAGLSEVNRLYISVHPRKGVLSVSKRSIEGFRKLFSLTAISIVFARTFPSSMTLIKRECWTSESMLIKRF